MKPKSVGELVEAVKSANAPFEILGSGTKRRLGQPVLAQPLDLSAFNAIGVYEPEELILESGPAIRLADLEKQLASKNQMLAFDPPDYSRLLGSKHAGTLGGALMCNLSGPRRLKAGAARDHVLGVSGVNGEGQIIKAGARVVKNVTGYDLPRLAAGSYGTLLALTSVIFKVMPRPETERTCLVPASTAAEAVQTMTNAMDTMVDVSSAAFVPGQGVYLRMEGIAPSVANRVDLLAEVDLAHEVLEENASRNLWAAIRDVKAFGHLPDHVIWRISLPPSDAAVFLGRLKFEYHYLLDWAGGLIWLAHEPALEFAMQIRASLTQGNAMLFRASNDMREQLGVFQPMLPALALLSARVKHAFDPKGLFNRGRMGKGF